MPFVVGSSSTGPGAVSYQLRAQYVGNYGGGVITYGPYATSFDVGAALTAGGGTITTGDEALVQQLDRYPPLFRSGYTGDPTPTIAPRFRALSVGNAATTTDVVLEAHLPNETYARWQMYGDGSTTSGTGSVAPLPSSAIAASGDTSGVTDATKINAALLAHKRAVGIPGSTYYVSSPIIPVSGSTLDMTGCTVILTAQTNMIQNAAVQPVTTATNVATTAGSSVVTSSTLAAAATVGQQLAVVGAGPAGGDGGGPVWLYGTVASIAGNNITLSGNINGVAATNTLSGATGYLFNRDTDIEIIGGTWDAGTIWNGSWRQTFNSHIMRLRRVDGLKVHGATIKLTSFPIGGGWVFGVNPQDCTDWDVWDITGDGASNIVQGAGPLYRGTVRDIQGQAQDDMVAFGNVAFQGDDTEGDIIDLEIDGIQANNSLRALKQFGGTGSNGAQRITSGFTFRSVKGITQTEPVAIIEYAGVTNIDCVGEDITAYAPGGYAQVYIAAQQAQTIDLRSVKWPLRAGVPANGLVKTGRPVQNLKVRELDIRSPAGTALGVLLTDSAGTGVGTYQQILIDGVSQPDTAPVVQLLKVATARPIDNLQIKGWRMRAASNSIIVYKNFSSALSQVDITDGRADGPNTFFFYNDSADTTNPVTLRLARAYGVATAAGALATLKSPSLILLSDLEWSSSAAGVQVNAGATPVRIEGSNLRLIGSSQSLFTRTSTQVVSVSSPQGTVDLAAITTNAVNGDIAYNSNAAFGDGVGLYLYRTGGPGTGWKNLSTLLPPEQLTTTARLGGMQPTGTLATTIVDRTDVAGTFTPTSGTLRLAAGSDIGTYIPAGTVITNLNVLVNGASGGATLTNSWLCIVRVSTLAAQATTVNRATTALLTTGAATVYPIATTLGGGTAGTWTCPVSDVYYIGFCVTGTTMPVLQGNTMATAAAIAPAITGNSSTALTTPATLPATVGALSGGGPAFWAWAT